MLSNILLSLLLLLQVLDIYYTNKALEVGGREANPVVKWFMDKVGSAWPIVKIPSVGIFMWWASYNAWLLLAVATVVYVYVCYNNYKIAKRK